MTSKERVLTALNHEEPDKIPIDAWLSTELFQQFADLFGMSPDQAKLDLKAALGDDVLYRFYGGGIWQIFDTINLPERKIAGTSNLYHTPWGITIQRVPYQYGAYAEIVRHPLADINNYATYKFPDPHVVEKQNIELTRNLIDKYGRTHAIFGTVPTTLFEACWYLRGMENFMVDMLENEDFADDLLDKVLDYHLAFSKEVVALGVDVIWWGDDIGAEKGPLISPALWRRYLKPRYMKMAEEVRSINKNIKIAFHSDGYVEHAMEDFIEIGFDILNPLQPGTNDIRMIKKKYGDKMTFWGNVDTRSVLANGTAKEVVQEIKNVIESLGHGGGLILGTNHKMQGSQRALDNAITYYWALEKWRHYPLHLGG